MFSLFTIAVGLYPLSCGFHAISKIARAPIPTSPSPTVRYGKTVFNVVVFAIAADRTEREPLISETFSAELVTFAIIAPLYLIGKDAFKFVPVLLKRVNCPPPTFVRAIEKEIF